MVVRHRKGWQVGGRAVGGETSPVPEMFDSPESMSAGEQASSATSSSTTDESAPGSPLANGPESRFVVEAIDAILRDDVVAARVALIEAAHLVGWPAVAHRLDVAGRALAVDAGFDGPDLAHPERVDAFPSHDPDLDLAELDSMARDHGASHASDVYERWSAGADDDLPVAEVWASLNVVAWLVAQAGYPAEVVV